MDEQIYQQALQETASKRFRGQKELVSKVVPQFPQGVEREYLRMSRSFMAEYDAILRRHMPELRRELGYYGGQRFDDVPKRPDEIFDDVQREFEHKILSFDLRKRLERIAHMNRKLTIAEWKRVCQRTLGIDIFEDYYSGDFFKSTIDDWIYKNVDLIVTQPKDSLGKMRELVRQGFEESRRPEVLAKEINAEYEMSKRHAMLIARDQTAKLNGDLTRKTQEDAGVNVYVWICKSDQRTRATHRKMHGLYCKYDDVTVYSKDKGETWQKKTLDMANVKGEYVHPEQDYQCRCRAQAVFTIAGMPQIPVKAIDWDKVDKTITYRDKNGATVTVSREEFFGKKS
jgi:SPP1 gp7 family putative phage head morphogenesis protein